ncbi:IQ and HECT domain-containing protein [Histoplasma capsulatum var. duboisii H88]|uniref:HECT-type E3 ubiquitin transferase n=1 Tax=Ajellomyces capsulatus (strain H88) TaxID=544711 RepID=A0A8A1LZX9_AJEC8|nr:IQ and HECT domain-containing protein [Histoplasma capsulatum var. duboisii H88]
MFQSFTGKARRPRQVNLSNRPTNPVSAYSSARHGQAGQGTQATIALAQQERRQRQLDRERLQATYILQRTWRGYKARKAAKDSWRTEWDNVERNRGPDARPGSDGDALVWMGMPQPYADPTDCLSQLRKLLCFIWIKDRDDWARLSYFAKSFQMTLEEAPVLQPDGEWPPTLRRLGVVTLQFLATTPSSMPSVSLVNDFLQLITFLSTLLPTQMTRLAERYYSALTAITLNLQTSLNTSQTRDMVVRSVLALLQPITSETLDAYGWFGRVFLAIPSLDRHLGGLDELAAGVNYKLLASAIDSHILPCANSFSEPIDVDRRLWLLSYFIYFHRHAQGDGVVKQAPETLFVKAVSGLLSPIAGEVSRRLGGEEKTQAELLPPFVRSQLYTLLDQHSITHLLSHAAPNRLPTVNSNSSQLHLQASKDVKALAAYALTLLRVFPKRGDEIRMWLYLGSAMETGTGGDSTSGRLPAIKYFWNASKSTRVFLNITQNSRDVLAMLQTGSALSSQGGPIAEQSSDREQEWTVILLFLELYTFLLKVLDDEEFFSATPLLGKPSKSNASWTQESALPLDDVRNLTLFLKNLAFTLYWNSADLTSTNIDPSNTDGIRNYFNIRSPPLEPVHSNLKSKGSTLVSVTGIPLDYFKGLVTGLLRMVHERDSRRKFLPDGHWLMVDRFDMEGFIPTVVAEEENRHQLQDYDEDDDDNDDETLNETMEDDYDHFPVLVGTGRAHHLRRIEELRKRQQQVARRKELEAVAPRLEILRNIPFFIPFATRVQIFREFIFRDQVQRRRGFIDPDSWRLSVAHSLMGLSNDGMSRGHDILSKHHANIRRESLFQDAFDKFYELGDGLKEPIQISFIDKFGTPEAGIDGGGVTKEFLTSVISDAFNPSEPSSLFIENDQHLLYPNPTLIEQRKAQLRRQGVPERSPTMNAEVKEILKRYEFLGRIIGKCLYEGILADVSFAGFFLLKWALTGGTSSARKESSYRANLNEVRDLDEGLYQGLLQLKNYPGDVEDFALNFTVTDTIAVPIEKPDGTIETITENITKDLKPHGSEIPVTNQNRLVYISYIARHRLQAQPYLQTNAFLQGLGTIIQPSWLSMFNQSELQTLVGGDTGEIDVADLRRNTVYSGSYVIGDDNQEHPTIKLFWEVLQTMTNADRQKLLKFVTSTPRAPLLGFSHLNPRFSIRDSSADEERLPSTSTCANLLKLPRYTRLDTLREKLMYAINAGAGFDLS